MEGLLRADLVVAHPFVTGELSVGNLPDRRRKLEELVELPEAVLAHPSEVLALIERQRLWSTGLGYIDAHLLASARLMGNVGLLTRDKRLAAAAERLGVGPTG